MPHVLDHKHAVAMQFASRPTLRQVAGQQIMKVMIERYPLIASQRPELTSAEAFKVMIPKPGGFWSVRPFVDYVLQAWLQGERLDFSFVDGLDYRLSLEVPSRFYAIKDPRKTADGDRIKLEDLGDALNDLLELFEELFCQAQVDYWREDASAGVSRDRWLQQTVKSALLENLALQNLDAEQQTCIRDLLAIGAQSAGVCILEVHMKKGGQAFSRLLPNLLVMAENDARKVFLWCAPSSVIQAFDSLGDFVQALQDELVDAYDFETLTWDRHELAGDVFAQWAAAMLEALLAAARRLQHTQLTNVDEAEQVLAALTDPSQYFIEGYRVAPDTHLSLPSEVQNASHEDSFAYQCALFDLALAQARSQGVSALADVLSLHAYASQRLREQLLKDQCLDQCLVLLPELLHTALGHATAQLQRMVDPPAILEEGHPRALAAGRVHDADTVLAYLRPIDIPCKRQVMTISNLVQPLMGSGADDRLLTQGHGRAHRQKCLPALGRQHVQAMGTAPSEVQLRIQPPQ